MILVADIGGTNARFALCNPPSVIPQRVETLACKGFSGLVDAAKAYLKKVDMPITKAVLALATDVHGERIEFVNNPWKTTKAEIVSGLELDELVLLNDFEAVAWSLTKLQKSALTKMGGGAADASASRTVIGPGTGLGVAQLIPSETRYIVQATEGGFASFLPQDEREQQIVDYWRKRSLMMIREHFLSGPGLTRVHTALSDGDELHPVDIVHGAHSGNELCRESLFAFSAMLGDVCADQALATGARGGVYIAGGVVPRFASILVQSDFRSRFESRGKRSSYLKVIPTWLITEPQPGLLGACARAIAQ